MKIWKIRYACLRNINRLGNAKLALAYNNFKAQKYTDENNILDTQIVKHYNDLLERQCSERGKDEVSYFYVGDVFCIHLGTKYDNFQEKIFAEIFP